MDWIERIGVLNGGSSDSNVRDARVGSFCTPLRSSAQARKVLLSGQDRGEVSSFTRAGGLCDASTKLSVGRLRGQFHAYHQSKVLVTYHPSYLLREPEVKKAAWTDLQFLLRDMAIELPKK